MSKVINGNFQDLDAAKRAVEDLLSMGFSADRTTCFSLTLIAERTKKTGHTPANDVLSDADHAVQTGLEKEAPAAAEGALLGAAVGGAIGVAFALGAPPLAAATALGIGAYGGSLYGALSGMEAADAKATEAAEATAMKQTSHARQSGTLVAAVANGEVQLDSAKRILQSHGATDIELREGILQNGQWLDFNPSSPLQLLPS